jgi:hypothetical protein
MKSFFINLKISFLIPFYYISIILELGSLAILLCFALREETQRGSMTIATMKK